MTVMCVKNENDSHLMECANLIRSECTDDSVENTAVVEEDKVVLFPIMGIHKRWRNAGALHLVQQLADLAQIGDFSTVWVKCVLARCASWERGDLDARGS